MSSKRSAPGGVGNLAGLMARQAKADAKRAKTSPAGGKGIKNDNIYLSKPMNHVEEGLYKFLSHARSQSLQLIPKELNRPIQRPFVEIEARIGILKVPFGLHQRRVANGTPSNGVKAYDCTTQHPKCLFDTGVTRSNYVHWTQAGLSEVSPLSHALRCADEKKIKHDIKEHEYIETVYGGYPNSDNRRIAFNGLHPPQSSADSNIAGKMEHKEKVTTMDVSLPAAPYDLRLTLAVEKNLSESTGTMRDPPPGWTTKRIKRRRSYSRRDKTIAWQIDVTEVTTSYANKPNKTDVSYEIEMELTGPITLQLINETSDEKVKSLTTTLTNQLWYILKQINPLSESIDVETKLRDHPDKNAVRLALATCGSFRKFMDRGGTNQQYLSPVAMDPNDPAISSMSNVKFVGCMPVNFSRHNIDDIQRSEHNKYYLSEKTDGVRYFMIFTGKTVVLVGRDMKGKQPIPIGGQDSDPMSHVLSLIKPGTVFDGEVVLNRKLKRAIFIVFDVLAIGTTEPTLHLPFEKRLQHLKKATFRTPTANRDMFDQGYVTDKSIPLPLVRKNFVYRTDLDNLLSHVIEERGERTYSNGNLHNHLTDGIIFQPNTPYVCGTDHNLLKWKYLDTVTIDVEILPPSQQHNFRNNRHNDDDEEDILRVGVLGEEGTLVDMTRFVKLPNSERKKLEADRAETKSKIAEVGFDPTTGEWYYLTMRPDKIAPNHISTVLGTLLELAEFLTTEELRYRMSVLPNTRDTYRKEVRSMQKQLLEHQRKKLQQHK